MRMGEFFSKQGQMLAMQAKISTDSMHIMSLKSRREAVSMHVITIWTLIFLPGTFVAVCSTFPLRAILTSVGLLTDNSYRRFSAVGFSILTRYAISGTGVPAGLASSFSSLSVVL